MTFGERLMSLRRARGLSREALGYMLDVTRQTVSKWERGDSTPELEKLVELSRIFGVSLDELAGIERTERPGDAAQARPEQSAPGAGWRWHYEYKSRRTLFGLPLLHINVGRGAMYRAAGIVAIGLAARGVVAVGLVSLGVLAVGAVSVGLLAAGAAALGGAATGAVAVGYVAVGSLAVGKAAIGSLAIGESVTGSLTLGGR